MGNQLNHKNGDRENEEMSLQLSLENRDISTNDQIAENSDSNGIMLPEGFSVKIVAKSGKRPITGKEFLWHDAPDGGAIFGKKNNGWIYVSNSERYFGGVSALEFNSKGELIDAYSICKGTHMNCAGGTVEGIKWLTCEETSTGQVYECDPSGKNDSKVLPALGRFKHEAVAEDYLKYKKKKYIITTSWITKTLKGGYSHNHRHRNSFWSGVYYFQDEYEDGSAELCFSNPNEQLSDVIFEENDIKEDVIVNSNSAIFNPEPKLLLLFPSYLGHQILHHGINTERLSLAFNIMPTVQWGGADSAININWFK